MLCQRAHRGLSRGESGYVMSGHVVRDGGWLPFGCSSIFSVRAGVSVRHREQYSKNLASWALFTADTIKNLRDF